MLLLGIDVGTSSVKVSVLDAGTMKWVASAQYPDTEAPIISLQPGWAEQDPEQWWGYVRQAIARLQQAPVFDPLAIGAIGIAYQMHGLVALSATGVAVRNSIIWCDSRAVAVGEEAYQKMGGASVLPELLNAPGNFTASKLGWVKKEEPENYTKINKVMLPGDYIAYRLTGEITTTASALSEGIFWDFQTNTLSEKVMQAFDFDAGLIPDIQPVFGTHGTLSAEISSLLGLRQGIPVTYKSGDQPNNALSLNVMRPGEVAATAGTSGVIYGVADTPVYDPSCRVNSFAHVNHSPEKTSVGVLLCINGCGIMNKSMRMLTGANQSYPSINQEAAGVKPGSNGLTILPFGNGAERMLRNANPGAQVHGWDFNGHGTPHFYRAAQEGIAFAFRYGVDIMRENGMNPGLIRAGFANMFLSEVFTSTLVNVLNIPVELYDSDGSVGAALGAGLGAGCFQENDLHLALTKRATIEPFETATYEGFYQRWLSLLEKSL
jgi:xylulokinase